MDELLDGRIVDWMNCWKVYWLNGVLDGRFVG